MGIYQTNELDTLTAQPIIDRLLNTLNDLKHNIFNNYIEDYIIESPNDVRFTLDYTPIEKSMYVMVNGIAYTNSENEFFKFHSVRNELEWNSSLIELKEGYRFAIIYSFDMDENNVNSDI